ncbi:hypothetical protein SAMN05216374_2774 [Tardiphaga sp. OK246]|nr:hypothetical protein SAMN05216374_2774 [Tardiphaga sp. OK246]
MATRALFLLLVAFAAAQSPAQAGTLSSAISSFRTEVTDVTPVMVRRGGMAVRRSGVAVGPRGGVAYRRGAAVVGPRGGVAVRRSAGVVRPGWNGGGVRWARPTGYWWRPGGAIAAGAAIGFVGAATAVAWAGAAPAPNMCWYYTDPSKTQGFWDACP